MVKRDSWGHSYSIVRGEILGFMEDEQLRKHLPRMFSLMNELGVSRKTRITDKSPNQLRTAMHHHP